MSRPDIMRDAGEDLLYAVSDAARRGIPLPVAVTLAAHETAHRLGVCLMCYAAENADQWCAKCKAGADSCGVPF